METIEDVVLRPNNFKCFAKPGRSVTSFPEKIRRRRSERSMMNQRDFYDRHNGWEESTSETYVSPGQKEYDDDDDETIF